MTKIAKRPIVVGLTGGIGSGKSTVAKLFNELGVESIDVDDIAREVVAPGQSCLQSIVKIFGKSVLTPEGALDRRALRAIVFTDETLLKQLEDITHPEIRARLKLKLSQSKGPFVLLVHPLLFETGQDKECDYIVAISLPESTQLQRVMQRDNNSEAQVKQIMSSQLTNEERIGRADFVLKNTGNHEELSVRVTQLYNHLRNKLI